MDHTYAYAGASTLESASSGPSLTLATSGGVDTARLPAAHPFFFAGTLRRPLVTAACLSTLSDVVASHFVQDAVDRLALKDPVVTSGDGTLRFEGFSGCCGLYARLDMTDDALNAVIVEHGTTNVDFNPPMISMLSRVSATDDVSFSVGDRELAVTRGKEVIRERKVKLPERWLRGFCEAAAFQARLEPAIRLEKAQAIKLISAIPRGRPKDDVAWLVPSAGGGVRFSRTRSRDGVHVRGVGRLSLLRNLARHLSRITISRDPLHEEVSAWQLELPAQRFTVVLSPGIYRGFSGEGQALASLAAASDDALLESIDERLCWQSALSTANVATLLDIDEQLATDGLLALAASGLMGYDSYDSGFFHRELPYNREKAKLGHPRLAGARRLIETGAVRWLEEGRRAEVRSGNAVYRVELRPQPPHACNCRWFAEHQGKRGTCKHVLATLMLPR